MSESLEDLQNQLRYTFKDENLQREALTHRSFVNEIATLQDNHNERLEFLGDAVVNLSVSKLLMEKVPAAREGELSKMRAMVVSEVGLSQSAHVLQLGKYLRMGKGEEQSGGREKPSILADAFEAMMGAIFIDAGFEQADATIRQLLGFRVDAAVKGMIEGDCKTRLQEFSQKKWRVQPTYKVLEEMGPDHAKIFCVAVYVHEKELAQAHGPSKKIAEQNAARLALDVLGITDLIP